MLYIGEQEVTVSMPKVKKFFVGSNFIGLANGEEPPAQVQNTNEEPQEEQNEEKEEE